MGKHSRERERSPRRKDRHDRDRHSDRHDRDRDRDRHRSSHSSSSTKKNIDAVKRSMKDKLNSAISDIKRLDQTETAENSRTDRDYTLTASETIKRTSQIERIEESGFVPATFISSRGSKKSSEHKKDEITKDHESAVFGPAWKSKELTKKLEKQEKSKPAQQPIHSIPMPTGPQFDSDFNDFPLAQKWLNSDPEGRQQNWIKTFHEQRKQLFDGVL